MQDKTCPRCGGSEFYEKEPWRCRACHLVGAKARRAEKKAARGGWSPVHDMTKTVPEGFHVKGVSTLYGADGAVAAQWVKTQKDQEDRLQQVYEAIERLGETGWRASADPVAAPARSDEDLWCVYPVGDAHIGMLAWAQETGESFDLRIAERDMISAIDELVAAAPPARTGLFASLGDWFHRDLQEARTVRSGNPLDVDGRWGKMLDVGIRCYRYGLEKLLQKHELVIGEVVIGNHDDLTSVMLAKAMALLFEREPRVFIDTRPMKFRYYEHGKCLFGFTHGDTVKKEMLPGIMAVDKREAWGRTLYRHWYTGHIHHDSLREYPGASVSSHRTLAARDNWHHNAGYRSDRDLTCEVWHREDGLVGQHRINVRRARREQGT